MRETDLMRRVGPAVLLPAVALMLLGAAAMLASTGGCGASPAAAAGASKPAIDPVQANGPIFVDWPKPQLAILFSGELDGYIEPCGCAGLENQMGGLKRRHTFVKQLEGDDWPLIKLDVGGLVKRPGLQSEKKYYYILDGLVRMGYHAVGLGPSDLRLNADPLGFALGNFPDKSPVFTANVGIYGFDDPAGLNVTRPYKVVELGGKRIGVAIVLGAKEIEEVKSLADFAFKDPAVALAEAAPKLAVEKCDLQILLVHGDTAEATALSQTFPQFQVVMAAKGAEVPPKEPKTIPGSGATLIEAGHKGMYAIALGMFDDPDPAKRFRYQRVPLDARFDDSPAMQQVLVDYQNELKGLGLLDLFQSRNPHPRGEFAGSATCMDCHTKAAEVFQNTPHAHATETLVKLDPPRQFDPECLSCHVTGWNPQEYFPYESGFFGEDATPALVGNGCENCHGPGKAHADAELGNVEATDEQVESLRAALRLKIVANEGNKDGQVFEGGRVVQMCTECHDIDNSPDFDFQTYWPEVKHDGKE